MITDIEKQFFETFGIKPRSYLLCTSCWDCIDAQPCEQCHYGKLIEDEYPKITDRILLELICIINQMDLYFYDELYYFTAFNYKDLKEEVISKCKRLADKNALSEVTGEHIKHKVRTLFEDGNE